MTLLSDRDAYAEHWMTFWNDLLRNDDGVSYFSEKDGRKSITPWLLDALQGNRPYNEFVAALLNPAETPTIRQASSSASTGGARPTPPSRPGCRRPRTPRRCSSAST